MGCATLPLRLSKSSTAFPYRRQASAFALALCSCARFGPDSIRAVGACTRQSRHLEADVAQCCDELSALFPAEGHQRRAHHRPWIVTREIRDGRLERGNHRKLLERAAHPVERSLLRVGVRLLP